MHNVLHRISTKISRWAGSTLAFFFAIAGIAVWLITGPHYHFSNTWLISISTITDVIIFIMVFSIQYTQNRDSKSIQLKLNELIIANREARDAFIGLETLTDEELEELDKQFKQILANMKTPLPTLHKLHKSIKNEKTKRPGLYAQAEELVDNLLDNLSGKKDKNN